MKKIILILTLFIPLFASGQSCPDTTVVAADTIAVTIEADSVTFWQYRATEVDGSAVTDQETHKESVDFGTVKNDLLTWMDAEVEVVDSILTQREAERDALIEIVEKLDIEIGDMSIEIEKLRKKKTRIKDKRTSL